MSVSSRHSDDTKKLNYAVRRTYEASNRRLDGIEQSSVDMHESIRVMQQHIANLDAKYNLINQCLDQVLNILTVRGAAANNLQQGISHRQELAEQRRERAEVFAQRCSRHEQALTGETERAAETVLRASARMPSMNTSIPKTFRNLADSWARHGLSEFETASRKNWTDNKIRQAYEKYLYLYHYLCKSNAEASEESMQQTITRLDNERGTMTLATYYRHLKARDPSVVPRRRGQLRYGRQNTDRSLPNNPTRTGASAAAIRQHQERLNTHTNRPNRTAQQRPNLETQQRTMQIHRQQQLRAVRQQPLLQAINNQQAPQNPRRTFTANAEGEIDGAPARRRRRRQNFQSSDPLEAEIAQLMADNGERFNQRTSGGGARLV